MRFRRFRRTSSRGPREPRKWIRTTVTNEFKVPLTAVTASELILFSPNNVNVISDEMYTPMRIVIDKVPSVKLGAFGGEPNSSPVIFQFDWVICLMNRFAVETFSAPSQLMKQQIFDEQHDVLQMGTVHYAAFNAPSENLSWFFGAGQGSSRSQTQVWVDFKPRRRVNTGDCIIMYCALSMHTNAAGGVPWVPTDANTHVAFDPATAISVLYQRTMRKR